MKKRKEPTTIDEVKKILATSQNGLEKNGTMHEIQQAFINHGAVQCGFCSPGMIMSVKHLLDENPKPTEEDIRRGMSGNLCRCTGYQQMVDAILDVSGQK